MHKHAHACIHVHAWTHTHTDTHMPISWIKRLLITWWVILLRSVEWNGCFFSFSFLSPPFPFPCLFLLFLCSTPFPPSFSSIFSIHDFKDNGMSVGGQTTHSELGNHSGCDARSRLGDWTALREQHASGQMVGLSRASCFLCGRQLSIFWVPLRRNILENEMMQQRPNNALQRGCVEAYFE